MDYTISLFTWSVLGYTQKSTTPILALKLSVSAIITPGGLPHNPWRVISCTDSEYYTMGPPNTDSTGQSALKFCELLKNGLLSFHWNIKGIVGVYNVACTQFGLAQYYRYYMKGDLQSLDSFYPPMPSW